MTQYFYDEVDGAMVAHDTEKNTVRLLKRINGIEQTYTPPAPSEEIVVRGPNKSTPYTKNPKMGKGCPECGSPSRHKATCSRAGTKKKLN